MREAVQINKNREPVLSVDGLSVHYSLAARTTLALTNVSLFVDPGEVVGIVGESGCGKSTLAYTIMRYLPNNARIVSGKVEFHNKDLLQMSEKDMLAIRGKRISIVPQDPLTSLNPSYRIGEQISEILQTHQRMAKLEAHKKVIELLEQVNIPVPHATAGRFPHEISGGQQQRVLIAMAFCLKPDLIIMDEPTTGLDVTTEAMILDLIKNMKIQFNTSILYITHNLGVVKNLCDRIITLYAGEIVEEGEVIPVFQEPKHPYTYGLLRSIPVIGARAIEQRLEVIDGFLPKLESESKSCAFAPRCRFAKKRCFSEAPSLFPIDPARAARCFFHEEIPKLHSQSGIQQSTAEKPAAKEGDESILKIQNVKKYYKTKGGLLRALEGINLECVKGEILGIVGESGCGKTTLARVIAGLLATDEGKIIFNNQEISFDYRKRDKEVVKKIQMVFQNPEATLNPQKTVKEIISRPYLLHRPMARRKTLSYVIESLEMVKLNEKYLENYPHELSGGEKQRVAIARALAPQPALLICDEPVSNLDVSIQAGILNLLLDLQQRLNITYLFISHDLNVVRYISNRIAVLYLGKLCEIGTPDDLFEPPYHPYTESLLSAIPLVQSNILQRRIRLTGSMPSPLKKIPGCVFHSRCPKKLGTICENVPPPRIQVTEDHFIYCHIPLEQLEREKPIIEPID